METLADRPARHRPVATLHLHTHPFLSYPFIFIHHKNFFVNCFYIRACSTYKPSMLHSTTPTGLLHLSLFLSFPTTILSSLYAAYSSWITLKMKASSYCETLVPVYQYTSHHISKTKTFISTTVRTSKSWESDVLVKVIMLFVLHIFM